MSKPTRHYHRIFKEAEVTAYYVPPPLEAHCYVQICRCGAWRCRWQPALKDDGRVWVSKDEQDPFVQTAINSLLGK